MVTAALVLMTGLAGCNSSDTKGALDITDADKKAAELAAMPSAVQGTCPKVVLREGTAFYTAYAKGAKTLPDGTKDPEQVTHQVSLADTTRQCTTSGGDKLTITVQAQGRVVVGPKGKAGPLNLPIRVAVVEADVVLYSELTNFNVEVPADLAPSQFVFSKVDVTAPASVSAAATIYVGFDEGPAKK
jgi:predicted small lipoprotein YifL